MNRYGFTDGHNVRPGLNPRTLRAIGILLLIMAGGIALVWIATL